MKITTLNLFGRHNWQKRESPIVSYLRSESPDIIFFQEVVYIPEMSPITQVADINKHLSYPHQHTSVTRLQTSHEYENYREGLSILSKFPITYCETIVLKQDPNDHLQRIVQLFNVNVHGHIIKFANVHFSENPELAYLHLEELLSILKNRRETRIIAGDFNMPDLKHAPLWKKTYKASTSEYYISYPSSNSRIDYILMPKSDVFVEIRLSPDTLSDHRALTAEIKLSK